MSRSTISVEYYAPKENPEFEAALDDLEIAGFQAAANGEPPNAKGLFALRRTVYFMGYRKGKAAIAAA